MIVFPALNQLREAMRSTTLPSQSISADSIGSSGTQQSAPERSDAINITQNGIEQITAMRSTATVLKTEDEMIGTLLDEKA
jgi:hypothetical protein